MNYQFGENNLLNKCKKSGLDGIIVVDLHWPVNKFFANKCERHPVSVFYFLSPCASNISL
jgi:Tryptophan synthase alpha chain